MWKPGRLSIGLAVVAASLVAASCTPSPTRESTGQYVDSSVISSKVRAAIVKDPQLSIFDIDVTTFRNVVQLSGFVNSQTAKERAGEVARSVDGVAEVKNNLVVKPG
jgi:osmotically-inducible protein OsmY